MTIPLCVDLDGTLIKNDTTYLALGNYIRKNPFNMLRVVWWFLHGRAYLKQHLAHRANVGIEQLHYNQEFIRYLQAEKANGRKLYLVTATDQAIANKIAEDVGLFDGVIASDGRINLKSHAKRAALDKRFGKKQYDYAGNDTPDLIVWRHAHQAIVVNASLKLQLMRLCGRVPGSYQTYGK